MNSQKCDELYEFDDHDELYDSHEFYEFEKFDDHEIGFDFFHKTFHEARERSF